jgi:hydrogenase maturation protein HypF
LGKVAQKPERGGLGVERRRVRVTGVVQGVGFRPFVYGLALAHGLSGLVGNDSAGVFIEVEGTAVALSAFLEGLAGSPPPLAVIETISVTEMAAAGQSDFVIVRSERQDAANTLISPDMSVCEDCIRDFQDPANRRYRYPFTNCTNCGPRFTIIQDIPYDRPLTTMTVFAMCPECGAEYRNPLDRRFHAQPNACPVCGPHVWLTGSSGEAAGHLADDDAIRAAQVLLGEGKIVAVKGLGGFHLACMATDDRAVALLRERKGRADKPFAVMAADMAAARRLAHLSTAEEVLLQSKERPIVLLRKRPSSPLSPLVAPGNNYIGIMLPYTPLHTLLLQNLPAALPVLVMTSGNISDEPIISDNAEAVERLSSLADAFLLNNRDIAARCDDSVIRVWRGAELPIRRSRGYAPFPVRLPHEVPPMLAVGGELKATFCLTKGRYGYMSQHIGDMENLETLQAFEQAVAHFEHIFRSQPELIACDMHPDYLSTRWALSNNAHLPVLQVQHHHAHIAAVMGEHRLDGRQAVIGLSFDGTGYGPDGAIWGGEVLLADYAGFERAAHLRYMPLAGGDAAVNRPYRLALSYLWAAGLEWNERLTSVQACPPDERTLLLRQLETNLNVVPTSSMGRLFDVVAALAGVRQVVSYEAQAAIEFEALADPAVTSRYEFGFIAEEVDPRPLLQEVWHDVLSGVHPSVISARFHNAVAYLTVQLSDRIRQAHGLRQVALGGGVFQNITLLEKTVSLLEKEGFEVLAHHLVPPNDGGLALGQALVAAAQ